MLVLTRKVEQRIQVGEDITITILRVKGNQVRIGIEAPRDVRVLRGELPPLPTEATVEVLADEMFLSEIPVPAKTTAAGNQLPAATSQRRGPLTGFFPKSMELAVANLSV